MEPGPQLPFSDETHASKYRAEGEDFREAMSRIANTLSDDPDHFHLFRDTLLHQRFLPAGRIQAAMGSTRITTAFNCFVSGTIDDSFTEGHGSIMQRAKEAAETMRRGGGIGYDFSPLRPKGALIKKLQSYSSGPISFMQIFDATCRCVASSGHRRGAQMGVLRVDHPDIEEFVHAKQQQNNLTGFNISVGITDEFMEAVGSGSQFALRFGGETYRHIDARSLWDTIMRSTWDWAEPGVLFLDRINGMNNLWYCETICASNPCGEQPLPPYGACLLGSFNLTKYLIHVNGRYVFDWAQFKADIPVVVRAMDNVVNKSIYPLREQELEAHSKRRMGLGLTGVANCIEAIHGHGCYGSEAFCQTLDEIMHALTLGAYRASIELAKEKGSFPKFRAEAFCQSAFVQNLAQHDNQLIADIREHGIRNSHLVSIAPTGTISMCADNVSSGIEPVFSYSMERHDRSLEGGATLDDYGFRFLDIKGKTAQHVTPEEHLRVLATAQQWVDSACSKTLNVPHTMPWEDFKDVYMQAWKMGCKGCATFTDGGKRAGVMTKAEDDEPASTCYIDPITGRHECE